MKKLFIMNVYWFAIVDKNERAKTKHGSSHNVFAFLNGGREGYNGSNGTVVGIPGACLYDVASTVGILNEMVKFQLND